MSDLSTLEAAFGSIAAETTGEPTAAADATTTDRYARRLESLLTAERSTWAHLLAGSHDYTSDSEADLAVVGAMVKRHFTDGEIWQTLAGSQLYAARVAKKGQAHTERLFAKEIAKARERVTPFDTDPGAPQPRVSIKSTPARVVDAATVDPSVFGTNGQHAAPAEAIAGAPLPDTSFIAKYTRYAAQRTDAPPEAHSLMGAGVLSALAGPKPRLPIATTPGGWSLVLWLLYIVNSTMGRKSTTLNLAKEIIAGVLGSEALIEWEGSPQGLIQKLQERDHQAAVFTRDEYSGLMVAMNRGGHMAGLPQVFIRVFDGGVLENVRTRKKNAKTKEYESDTDRVEEPYLVKLCASTWDSFLQRCTIDNVLDGFLARFAFTTGAAQPRPLPRLTSSMLGERDLLIEHGKLFHLKAERIVVLRLGDDVLGQAWDLEQEYAAHAVASMRPDAAAPSLKRLSEAVLKTAGLLAIDAADVQDDAPIVTVDHFDQARTLGEVRRTSTLRVVEGLGATTFMRDTEAVAATVQARSDGIAVRDIMRQHRRIRTRDFEEILATLEEREEIEIVQVKTDGRPRRVVYLFGHAPRGAS
jgi:hypothetical protein